MTTTINRRPAVRRRQPDHRRRPTTAARPTSRCWRRRSAPTSTAPPPRTATGRRWSSTPPAAAGPTRSCAPTSTRSPTACCACGIEKGDRVGIWAPNCAEWTQLQYATAKIGAILVCINPAYRTHELQYVLNQAGVRLLVAARSFKTSDYAAMIAEVRAGLPRARARRPDRQRRVAGAARPRRRPGGAGRPRRRRSTRTTRSTSSTPRAPPGTPRAPPCRHHNILNNAHLIGEVCRYTEADRICVPVPLFHTFGMVIGNLGATTRGACLVYPAPSFDAARHPGRGRATSAARRCYGRARHVHRRAGRARRERARDATT